MEKDFEVQLPKDEVIIPIEEKDFEVQLPKDEVITEIGVAEEVPILPQTGGLISLMIGWSAGMLIGLGCVIFIAAVIMRKE